MMKLLSHFIDWHKNRQTGGATLFFATYDLAFDLNLLKDPLILFLGPDLTKFYEEKSKTAISSDFLKTIDFNPPLNETLAFHTDFELPVSSITIRRDKNHFNTCALFSIGFAKNYKAYKSFETFLGYENLYLASYEEIDYINWQNCFNPRVYKFKGNLKLIKNAAGESTIDPESRPGRSVFTKFFRFAGSSKLWFGKAFFQYLDKGVILGCKTDHLEILEMVGGGVYVNLYDDVYAGDAPQSQIAQKKFRESIKVDSIVV